MKRDIKGPLPVRVRLGLGYGLGYEAFCPGFDLIYSAEIRGQPLVLLYKMIVCAGWSEKTAGPISKIHFGSYRFGYGICQKNTKILYKLINYR